MRTLAITLAITLGATLAFGRVDVDTLATLGDSAIVATITWREEDRMGFFAKRDTLIIKRHTPVTPAKPVPPPTRTDIIWGWMLRNVGNADIDPKWLDAKINKTGTPPGKK